MGLEEYLDKNSQDVEETQELSQVVDEENQIATQILKLEKQVTNYKTMIKDLETKENEFKTHLLNLMTERGVKSWKTPNKITFTVVAGKEPETVLEQVFDEKRFKEEEKELYEKYQKTEEKIKAGRKSYLKITLPKEN